MATSALLAPSSLHQRSRPMGDMADWCRENGEDDIIAHYEGDCGFGCPRCAAEEKKRKARKRAKKKGATP